jgi:hypothetical protein
MIFSSFSAVFSTVIAEDSHSSQKAVHEHSHLIDTFWNVLNQARNIPFLGPSICVSLNGSLTWSLVCAPMLLTWFGVLCISAGPQMLLFFKICHMLLVGVMLVASFMPSLHGKAHGKAYLYLKMMHESPCMTGKFAKNRSTINQVSTICYRPQWMGLKKC